MLDSVDMTQSLTREEYATRRLACERELFDLVRRAKAGGVSCVVVFEGLETAGKGRAIFTLTERLDPRTVVVIPVRAKPRSYERERPWLWRFWMKIPARGEMSIFDTSWYGRVLGGRISGRVKKKEWRDCYEEIESFERQLVDDGTILIKLWLHVDKKTQKKRLKRLAKSGAKMQIESCRAQHASYREWVEAVEDMLARTSTTTAPWTIVPSNDVRFAKIRVFEAINAEMKRVLDARGVPQVQGGAAAASPEPAKAASGKSERVHVPAPHGAQSGTTPVGRS